MTPPLRSPRAVLLVCALAGVAACRFEVRLDEPRDAGPDARGVVDAGPLDAPPEDSGPSDAPDAPARACLAGVTVVPSPVSDPSSEPTLASTGTGATRLYALLLPPPARMSSTRTALYLFDVEGSVASMEEFDFDDGAAGPAATATVHRRRDSLGVLVLAPTEMRLRDGAGAWTSIALPLPPLVSRQRGAGWIDAAHFAYVGDAASEPIVIVEPGAPSATVSTLGTAGAARVLIGSGAIVVSPALPDATILEYDAALVETLRLEWPMATPAAGRLIGANLSSTRRWLVHDEGEFRTQTQLYAVDMAGATFLSGQMLQGPLVTESGDDLVTILTSDRNLTVFDFTRDAFVTLVSGVSGFGLAQRDDAGYVVVTREATAGGDALVVRCVATP